MVKFVASTDASIVTVLVRSLVIITTELLLGRMWPDQLFVSPQNPFVELRQIFCPKAVEPKRSSQYPARTREHIRTIFIVFVASLRRRHDPLFSPMEATRRRATIGVKISRKNVQMDAVSF